MKKKTLFSLLMASAMVVSCQQDELVSIDKATSVDLGNRPELGAVTLGMEDPATRMALNTVNNYSFKWEEGDKLGAAIVDTPVETAQNGADYSAKGGEDYSSLSWTYAEYVNGVAKDFTNKAGKKIKVTAKEAGVNIEAYYTINQGSYISSNYPYLLDAGSWTTQANLVEGNYVFYAPYNAAHLTRQPIVVTLPMIQDCSTESKALTDFYKGNDPVALAFSFLEAPEDKSQAIFPKLKTTNIFAYPQITIKNNFNGYLFNGDEAAKDGNFYSSAAAAKYTMKINSVEIYTTGNASLNYKRALDASEYKSQLATGWDKEVKEDGTKIFTTGETSKILSATGAYNVENFPGYKGAEKEGYATEYAEGGKDLISAYQMKRITCSLGGKELKNGEEYKFFAIMPAEDYEKVLFAKVNVEINGQKYIILSNSTKLTVNDTKDDVNKGKATFGNTIQGLNLTDYNFRDAKHGDQGVRLVRGQRYPSAEVLEDASAVKNFAGSLMTINLEGGLNQAAYAMAKVAPQSHYGIKDNADFIDHITKNVQRGVDLVEKAAVEQTDRKEWAAQDIAFASNNTVVINAELIKALYNRLYDKRPAGTATGTTLTLNTTELPIANDVTVALNAGVSTNDTYTFTTADGVSYDIKYAAALVGSKADALINGINKVTGTVELKAAKKVTGAVVIVESGAATLNNATGITAIQVATGATLNVNCASDALIQSKGTVVMGKKAELTNPNNVFEGTVDNNNLRPVAGNTSKAVVAATYNNWPTTIISANTQINKLTVGLGTGDKLTLNDAQVGMLANLKDVNVVLEASVKEITSNASVTLTNIKSMKAESAIQWTTTANNITVTYAGEEATFFENITAATGVTFAN